MNLLLVEDNPADVRLFREALKLCDLHNVAVHVVGSADEAMLFVNRSAPFQHVPSPSLIVLDWNMPKRTGADLLRLFKAMEQLRAVPVVIHSSSANQAEIRLAYNSGASCWVQKATELDTVIQRWCAIVRFWTNVAELPHGG